MNYGQLLQYLSSLHKTLYGVKIDRAKNLALVRQLNKLVTPSGTPSKIIHIAGTSGKGSVAVKIAKALELSGYRVGLYLSPHIHSLRERITINGSNISKIKFTEILNRIIDLASSNNIQVVWFDLLTCVALDYFSQENLDFIVIEAGIGGRFDSTNIITPLISVITALNLDHKDVLGESIEEIAYEKAGIIKPNVPVILGPRVPAAIFIKEANKTKSRLWQLQGEFETFDAENQTIAKAVLNHLSDSYAINPEAIKKGIKKNLPCRLEILTQKMLPKWQHRPFPKAIILDGAHNPDKLVALFRSLRKRYPKTGFQVLFSLAKNKDLSACLQIVANKATHIHLSEMADSSFLASGEILLEELNKLKVNRKQVTLNASLAEAIALAAANHQILVVCGTFRIMSAIFEQLGIEAEVDPIPFLNYR
jgi:dihydrofolate synthase/folylpolyglutamate synthase